MGEEAMIENAAEVDKTVNHGYLVKGKIDQ
jgi:hypothetical protein